ncbi:MAG: class I adenylate-forming enzyme family protein [Pseudomonadota bacterium]
MTPTTWEKVPYDEIPDLKRLSDYVRWYAEQKPNAEACVDFEGRRLTYLELKDEVEKQSMRLRKLGVAQGDILALLSPPCVEFWIFFLATIDVGATFLGLNPRYTENELRYAIDKANPKLILICEQIDDTAYDKHISALKASTDKPERVVPYELGSLNPTLEKLDDIVGNGASSSSTDQIADHCLLVFTSGTTGQPKGALLSEEGLVYCSRVHIHHMGKRPPLSGAALNPFPINHVACVGDVGATCLIGGGKMVFMHFEPVDLLRAIEQEKITGFGGIPTMLQLILSVEEAKTTDFSSIERILWGGAPMPRPLGQILQMLGRPLHTFYGLTETTGNVTFTDPDASLDDCIETIGKADPHHEVRIADANTDEVVSLGKTGEIQVKSPGNLKGYLNDPEATKATFTEDGFLKTGDLGYQREDGAFVLNGRIKEMFKSGGYNVYPREVEAAIEQLNGVAMACVVPVPDPVFHEVGFAYLVPSGMGDLELDAVKDQLRDYLANYKIPKYFEISLEPPILANGKLDRVTFKKSAVEQVKELSP